MLPSQFWFYEGPIEFLPELKKQALLGLPPPGVDRQHEAENYNNNDCDRNTDWNDDSF